MARVRMITSLLACFLLVFAGCSSDDDPKKDDGGVPEDSAVKDDKGTEKDGDPPPDTTVPDVPTKDDSKVTFVREVELANDDGLPAIKLASFAKAKAHSKFEVEPSLLPVEVRRLKIMAASAHGGVISIHDDAGGALGAELAQKDFSISATDIDKWHEIDVSDLAVQVNGDFWVSITYADATADAQETVYGGTYSSGNVLFWRSQYGTITTNFDQLFRAIVATPKAEQAPVALGADGDACKIGLDCDSGYCQGSRCTITCDKPSVDCGAERQCRRLETNNRFCIYKCSDNADCPADAFCLTDANLFEPAGFCVRGGSFANGKSCQYQYHTACASGKCSACDANADCSAAGTCQAK